MSSDNLGAPSVAVGQSQKEVTINEAVNKLDNATQGVTALTITGTRTLTAAEFTGGYSLELTGTPGAAFTLNVPASRRSFRVDNATDGDATVQVDGGAGASVVVAQGSAAFLYSDGADVTEEGGGGGGGDTGVDTLEGGTEIVADSTDLNFDGDHFNLADGGAGQTNISLADQGAETRVDHTGTDQNIGATRTQVQWNNEIRDEGAWHDPATNNERIVIGTETVDVDCSLTLLNLASADVEARIARYNSADALQEVHARKIEQSASLMLHAQNVRGAAAGDYLVIDLLSSDASYDVDGDESYLMVRRAGKVGGGGGGAAALEGVRVERVSTVQAIADLTGTAIIWNSVPGTDAGVWDEGDFHDPAGANPTRVIIPTGSPAAIYAVTAGWVLQSVDSSAGFLAWIAKNAEGQPGRVHNSFSTNSGIAFRKSVVLAAEIELVGDDYLELFCLHNHGSSLDIQPVPATFMTVRKIAEL